MTQIGIDKSYYMTEAGRKGDMKSAEHGMFRALASAEAERLLPSSLVETAHELAGSYCVRRQYSDAARVYRRVLTAREKILGENHPDLVDSLDRLAVVLGELDSKSDAMAAQFRAMSIRTRLVAI
jgi:hypothetical protein